MCIHIAYKASLAIATIYNIYIVYIITRVPGGGIQYSPHDPANSVDAFIEPGRIENRIEKRWT